MCYTSERLNFRQMKACDFELYFKVFGDQEVMKFAMLNYFESREALRPYFNKVLANDFSEKRMYDYVISTKEGIPVGIGELEITVVNSFGGIGEIGYFLLPDCWGRGYATEAASTLCDICFREYGVHKVFAGCHADNMGSEKIMRKIGMKEEGRLRAARFKEGGWHDELRYSILREEWK